MNTLLNLVKRHKAGEKIGIYSVCSAHSLVIEASLKQALSDNSLVLIEATSNQVDQFGGYTGMKPADFRAFVLNKAAELNFPAEKIILGGDHLGPNRWQGLPAEEAMANADVLIAAYVEAGFEKIHLDCSMSCADDPIPLSDEIVATRAARLAAIAEKTAVKAFGKSNLVYVVGTEVPVPGGAAEELEELEVTSPAAAKKTIDCHYQAFADAGVASCLDRIVGLVVQPGVEFDHTGVIDYDREKAQELSKVVADYDNMVFEAHSTDYQTDAAYKALVEDHFAILKVGPALTFALREALFSLCAIENEMFAPEERSNLRDVIEAEMLVAPAYWEKYYQGTDAQQRFSRCYSFSDRIRYYWPNANIIAAQAQLFRNLEATGIALPLLSQYLPEQFRAVREGQISALPEALVIDKIQQVMRSYAKACI